MELTGKVLSRRGSVLTIELNDDSELYKLDKYDPAQLHQVGVLIDDKRRISTNQRKFAWYLIEKIYKAQKGGHWLSTRDEVYDRFKYKYLLMHEDEEYVSLSRRYGNMSQANDFINLLLQFCLENEIGIGVRPIDYLDPDGSRQVGIRLLDE
ncbi:hypothetical protein [Convivina praedatoris]|uniref:hypothetical protein n=1 Tax=Convivina praedatoris TaxID=2880963 RepID=UPI00200E9764|nr:hypothetical protein [Convivina sp. LMG 32447]CAH1857243.1 hypothetical protein R077815_01554 [Convivina sp. LMG 32447]